MKNTLAIFLALIMILSVSLVACNNNATTNGGNGGGIEDDDDDSGLVAGNKGDKNDEEDGNGDGGNGGNGGNVPSDSDWVTTTAKVYAMADQINLRTSPDTSASSKKCQVNRGTELNVIAKSVQLDDYDKPVWYKISYTLGTETLELYVSGAWVEDSLEDTQFVDCEKTALVMKDNDQRWQVNLRSDPAVTDATLTNVLITKDNATTAGELKKVAESKTGLWFKVEFDSNNDGTAEIYYIKMISSTREYFGLSSGSQGGGNG